MAVLFTPPYQQFFDDDGNPLSGGKVFTYAAGSYSTPKAAFTTAAGDIELDNPIILDAAGRAVIFIDGAYNYIVKDANDVTIRSVPNVTSFTALDSQSDSYQETFSGNGTQTAFTTSDDLGTDEKAIYIWVDSGLQQHVANGTFATDTIWTKGSGWTIGAGVATATGAISTAISQTSAVTLVQGQAYIVTYTITRSAGDLIPSIGGTNGVTRSASGTYVETIIAGSTQVIAFTGVAFTGTLDTVTVTPAVSKGYQIQPATAFTINGTALTFNTAPAIGTGNILVSAPLLAVGSASSSAAAAQAAEATALAAQVAAESAAANLRGTSTTSLAIGTGSKVFTTQAGKQFNVGNWILAVSDAGATNYMHGQVTAYSGTNLTLNVTNTGGTGTFADWSLYISGTQGATGATGSISDLSGVPTATIAAADTLVFTDVSDSNLTKKTTYALLLGSAFQSVVVREFTATGAGTYTPTTNTVAFIAEWVGAGGGGGARVTNNGSDGGTTTFDSIVANGGEGGRLGGDGTVSRGGVGGTGGTGTADVRVPGGGGHLATGPSSAGGDNPLFPSSGSTTTPAGDAVAGNKGCGGGGGNANLGSTYSGGGGGGGEYCRKAYSGTIAGSYSYTIGTGGSGGAAGTIAGGAGGNGYIRITEFIKA